jgi:hypothetical protein
MALMIDHSASVSSRCGLGIKDFEGSISTIVETVKRNIYNCKGVIEKSE